MLLLLLVSNLCCFKYIVLVQKFTFIVKYFFYNYCYYLNLLDFYINYVTDFSQICEMINTIIDQFVTFSAICCDYVILLNCVVTFCWYIEDWFITNCFMVSLLSWGTWHIFLIQKLRLMRLYLLQYWLLDEYNMNLLGYCRNCGRLLAKISYHVNFFFLSFSG